MPGRRTLLPLSALTAAAVVLGLALLVRPGPAGAAPAEPVPSDAAPPTGAGVAVGGIGTATGTPDVLRVTVGVEVSADSVGDALSGADEAARRVIGALRDADVPGRDVRTANVAVHPRYGAEGESITGYTARHDLSVTLREIGAAGAVIASVAEAGGDAARIDGISYALEDDAELQAQARAAAFADARRRAEQYADLVGRELGEVLEVRENVSPSVPMPYAAAEAADSARPLALEPGSTAVTVTAEVRWSLR